MSGTIVMDLDGTLTVDGSAERYEDAVPDPEVVAKVRLYAAEGFRISVMTSRNMRSFENSIGRINAHTLPVIVDWLRRHRIPFDEIHVGKPWCGAGGFYVDDRAVRPSEFLRLDAPGIADMLERERRR